jgi:hypothetical protein
MAKTEDQVVYASPEEAEKAIQDADLEITKWQAFKTAAHAQLDRLTTNTKVDKTLGQMSPGEREIAIKRLSQLAEEDRKRAAEEKDAKAKADAEQAKADEATRLAAAEAKKNQ